MAKEKKTKPKPPTTAIIGVAFVMLVIAVLLITHSYNRLNVSCQQTVDEAKSLNAKRQYEKTYALLTPKQKQCGAATKKSSETEKITGVQFHRHLSVSAYLSGHKKLASAEAEKGIALSKHVTGENQQSSLEGFVIDMVFVKENLY